MATDFFEHQDSARRQTARLVVLFVLSVAAIIAAVYAVATLLVASNARGPEPVALLDPARLALVATAVLVVVTGGSLYKTWALGEGGDAIATMLGGRPIPPSTTDHAERRLLNVVEEMALAAGTPVPPVYVLDEEPSINAFAAGHTPGDAVIGVSRGCLDHLNRDELQGVIGHEFSHILNGDMRLNLRLIGLIHGILVLSLIGQLLFRSALYSRPRSSRRDEKGGGGVVLFLIVGGAALWLIGLIGVLFGRLIKSAISRQREFLADASAVQFTRNPEGLAGALKKIGGLAEGSRLRSPNAEQAAHMFFGQGVLSLSRLLATHPPLEERIRRLDPRFDGRFAPEPSGRTVTFADDERRGPHRGLAGTSAFAPRGAAAAHEEPPPLVVAPEAAVASVGEPTPAHVGYAAALLDGLPPILFEAVHDPFSARAVVYALLIDEHERVAHDQLEHLDDDGAEGTAVETLRVLPAVRALGREARIPLVDLTFPALRRLSPRQFRAFRANVEALVKADRRVNLFEYVLQRMLFRHLDHVFAGRPPAAPRFGSIDPVFGDALVLLSALARLGQAEGPGRDRAFAAGLRRLQAAYPGERVAAMLPEDRCGLPEINRALDRLAMALPDIKLRVIDACAACIGYDGLVVPGEGELLRAITDSLDCPMPPLPPTAGLAAR